MKKLLNNIRDETVDKQQQHFDERPHRRIATPRRGEEIRPTFHGSLGPQVSPPPNGISIGSAVFCKTHPCAQHTDTQTTLRVTFVAIGRTSMLCTRRGLKTSRAIAVRQRRLVNCPLNARSNQQICLYVGNGCRLVTIGHAQEVTCGLSNGVLP